MKPERTQFRLSLVPEWKLDPRRGWLTRRCQLLCHSDAMVFADQVSDVACKFGESPLMVINGHEVTIRIGDGESGGISEGDFDLAEQIDELTIKF